ncbi:hypothetical protein OIO90_002508 [Microbotryomycetes sp. JL221]|nr:hypothetical protein OIO90_002508 [Microbotryomycetes sp. JL221]
MQSILVSTFTPFPSISLALPSTTPVSALSYILSPLCPVDQQSLSVASTNKHVDACNSNTIASLCHDGADSDRQQRLAGALVLRLTVKLPGGKGGFASQLRAQGGRMSSNKATNNDSCRDLNGRRLSTIKEAQKLAEYIQSAPQREQAQKAQAQAKLDALNEEIKKLSGESSQKRRLDDNDYIEQSREIVEGVKDAVKLAMLKKRKKNNGEKENKAVKPTSATNVTSAAASALQAEAGHSSSSPEGAARPTTEDGAEHQVADHDETKDAEKVVPAKSKGKGKGRANK